jgi:hypothetical protein
LARTVNQEENMRKLGGSTSAAVVVTALLFPLLSLPSPRGKKQRTNC